LKALILTAGLGTRLGELTKKTPKPLLPVGGEPILTHVIKYLAGFGFNKIALNLHFHPEAIRSVIGDGSQFGVEVTYSFESELLGTAGALKPLRYFFEGETDFLVYYGDVVTNQDISNLIAFHRSRQALATLLIHTRKNSNSVIELGEDNRIITFLERPKLINHGDHLQSWVNSGVQVLSPRIFDCLPDHTPSDLPRDIYAVNTKNISLYGYPLSGYRCAVDSQERYEQVCHDFQSGKLTFL
jgi:mannose-1-phosphate guanylyltransferase